jgi:aspartate-semialdehyde dehydrogenase
MPDFILPENPVVAIAGATGAVGREMLAVLEQRNFPCGKLKLLASSRSAGSTLPFRGEQITVEELTEKSFEGVDVALFSAGGPISKKFGPIAGSRGTLVIDNSSAFRMDEDVPLVVPEINDDALDALEEEGFRGLIANPNCSTIIALMAVTPLYDAVGIERMVVSTYQAASGGGAAMMQELEQQARDYAAGRPYTQAVLGRQ